MGLPWRARYRVGDNVWLKVAVTNDSTESLKVPKGEDYTRPKVIKDGIELPYKKDISERVKRNDSGGSHIARGFWVLKPYQTEFDVVDLSYWYDLHRATSKRGRRCLTIRKRNSRVDVWSSSRNSDLNLGFGRRVRL